MINNLSKPGLIARKIEDKGLVENRVQRSLLHVRLLLRDPLTIVHQVDLHVRICKKYFRFSQTFFFTLLAILNLGQLEKRHWKQLHKKELHVSRSLFKRLRYEFLVFFFIFLFSVFWSCCQEWFLWDCEENVRNTNLLGTDAIVRDYREPCTVTQTREDKSQ